jgi:hypothetical protein
MEAVLSMGWSGSWLLISVVRSCRKSEVVSVFVAVLVVDVVALVPDAAAADVTEETEYMA